MKIVKILGILSLFLVSSLPSFSIATNGSSNSAVKSTVKSTTKSAEELIIENPVREYKKYRARLQKYGPNAPFPEFKPVVDEILKELRSIELQKKLDTHPILKMEYAEVITFLSHINLSFSYENQTNYPYINDYNEAFPYRPTIDAIESALRLFDKIERLENPNVVPLYHFDRYAYHRHSLLADTENIFFPTMKSLSFTDLIKIRSVPIGFVGVTTKTIRVDRYFQSPLDFWYHDINHVRRLAAYLKLKMKNNKATTQKAKLKLYAEMDSFIQNKILPNIARLPKGSHPEDIAIRRLARLIIFEIFHESAVAADVASITQDLLRGPDIKTPFEIMIAPSQTEGFEIEKMRTAVGNVQSGAKIISENNPENKTVHIHYYHDRDLGLLANVYNKLLFGYYDEPSEPSELIAPVAYRKAEYIAKAAQYVLEFIGAPPGLISREELKKLILSKAGRPELFNYEQLLPHEAEQEKLPEATEPITADEVIARFKLKNKKVHTIFGFSDLEYEHKDVVLKQIRIDLEKLDPKTTIINIGATEDGVGAAYKIAKDLGFETTGIVSMQALSYSGQFSKFVDSIYILSDGLWGGFIPGTRKLTPTTQAFISVSDSIAFYGGNLNSLATLKSAIKFKIPFSFYTADMNHKILDQKLKLSNQIAKTYKGAAELFWSKRQKANLCFSLLN